MPFHRATYAEIDLKAFRENLRGVRAIIGPQVKIMAVVKADGYGHGAVHCARAALEAGADSLGVAILEEGIELRENNIRAPILLLCGIFPDEIEDFLQYDLATTLYGLPLAKALAQQAKQKNQTVAVHLKTETGMGRLGIPHEELLCFVKQIQEYKNLRIEAVATHFSSADEEEPDYTLMQLSRFNQALNELRMEGVPLPLVHSANTSALIRFPQSRFNMVRPGILLYGALPSPGLQTDLISAKTSTWDGDFQPVMHWKSKILQINEVPKGCALSYGGRFVTKENSRIAVLPVGYADGLNRRLSNKMKVLVRGTPVPQVGTICMDLCLADVTGVPEAEVGDEVVLFGRQGKAVITVDEMAQWADTLSYEILCNVGKRVPRVYLT
ncbi:MAG: alanine racemase [Nitrospinaceae bacterium]